LGTSGGRLMPARSLSASSMMLMLRSVPAMVKRPRANSMSAADASSTCAAISLPVSISLSPDVPKSLDISHISDNPPFSFPNGCHIAEVEIDKDTGQIEVVRYSMVNDFGTVINPMLVAGQAHGGIMQGIGQALMERTVYDEQGQPIAGSYMDYALPRASDAPDFTLENHSVPCKTNRLGVKGCGEAGCAGALPSVMNAVVDALSGHGVTHVDMPVTPEKVWRILNRA
jgi:aerobic carbon-monoxide dehydrogenase large subunit